MSDAALHVRCAELATVLTPLSCLRYHLGQLGLWCEKAMPYAHDTRVPLYVRGPGVPPGAAAASLVAMNVDVGPTLLELAGAPDA